MGVLSKIVAGDAMNVQVGPMTKSYRWPSRLARSLARFVSAVVYEVRHTFSRACAAVLRSEAGATAPSLLARYRERQAMAERFVDAYRRYCWPVSSLADLRLAPFHLLASDGTTHTDKDHLWHMGTLSRLCAVSDGLLLATPHRTIDVNDPASVEGGIRWWEELTERGGEGMVVKPLDFIATGARGLVQPAVKCRGREYLRIIYGPEYTAPENLDRLRVRSLAGKRSLALREFALGIEGLERFVRGEPLRRVHECVFGVLAMESEPMDPRL